MLGLDCCGVFMRVILLLREDAGSSPPLKSTQQRNVAFLTLTPSHWQAASRYRPIKRPLGAHQSYTFVQVWDLTPMCDEALFVNLGHGTGHHRIS